MKIVNLKDYRGSSIRCDRSSELGNPFILRSEIEREKVCYAFREYFWLIILGKDPLESAKKISIKYNLEVSFTWSNKKWTNEQIMKKFNSLKKYSVLSCWCMPKMCHCEVLVSAKNWYHSI